MNQDLPKDSIVEEFECFNAPLRIESTKQSCDKTQVDDITSMLDIYRGVMLTSRFEYPGRYTRWDIGSVNPPLVLESKGKTLQVTALNDRGKILIPVFKDLLARSEHCKIVNADDEIVEVEILEITTSFVEEHRSRIPHVLNVLRYLKDCLAIADSKIGFYGAFGYDLGLDFLEIEKTQPRDSQRDLILYFIDELFITDHELNSSYKISYEFDVHDDDLITASTRNIERNGERKEYHPAVVAPSRSMERGQYSKIVENAKDYFARGDLFEVVPSQSFHEPCSATPSDVFNELLRINPAPYGALINLGQDEWTISASPEMFVRVEGSRVESCPIAGTIARGSDGITDLDQINKLLSSEKEASELLMCTDVDRNDKSRVCVPGSVKVIGRRQIEMYSRLIHTVDHVEGQLLDGLDCIDAFLTHTWAVTVTGAPKISAMKFIEQNENEPRRFYGGAMGLIALDGTMNTGLMLRTIHIRNGQAHIRVGATLLYDSDPVEEEKETELKASAMLDVVRYCHAKALGQDIDEIKVTNNLLRDIELMKNIKEEADLVQEKINSQIQQPSRKVLLIDCEDSFVHTLGGYLRLANSEVLTKRIGFSSNELQTDIDSFGPDIICLSPGPGSPKDFKLDQVIEVALKNNLPIFGVCLGLQALVEYYGGSLSQLDVPVHGKASAIELIGDDSILFAGLENGFEVGRYHSLYVKDQDLPSEFKVTALSQDDEIIMAIEHKELPMAAVQFHPESIMTIQDSAGLKIVTNAMENLIK